MRISDWSSDVCSSDLRQRRLHRAVAAIDDEHLRLHPRDRGQRHADLVDRFDLVMENLAMLRAKAADARQHGPVAGRTGIGQKGDADHLYLNAELIGLIDRSEEHTSELQSLMRISYAV